MLRSTCLLLLLTVSRARSDSLPVSDLNAGGRSLTDAGRGEYDFSGGQDQYGSATAHKPQDLNTAQTSRSFQETDDHGFQQGLPSQEGSVEGFGGSHEAHRTDQGFQGHEATSYQNFASEGQHGYHNEYHQSVSHEGTQPGEHHELYQYPSEHKEDVKVITVEKKVPVPYPVTVEKKVPYKVEVPVDKPYPVEVPKPYPVTVEKKVPYEVRVHVPVPYTVEKKIPYKVEIPVDKPYFVDVPKPYNVYIEKKVPYHVAKYIPYEVKVPVDKPYPVHVPVVKKIPYTVEKRIPVEVRVPVDKPYNVEVPKPYKVSVEKKVPYTVEKHVPYEVKVPVKVPYPVVKTVPVLADSHQPQEGWQPKEEDWKSREARSESPK